MSETDISDEFVLGTVVAVSLKEWERLRDLIMVGAFPMSLWSAIEKVLGRAVLERVRDHVVAFELAPSAAFPMPIEKRLSTRLYPKDWTIPSG